MTAASLGKIEGLTHWRDMLIRHIPAKARERVVVGALRRSFKPTVVQAKANAANTSGALAESIQVWKVSRKKKSIKSDTFTSIEIGPRRSNKRALGTWLSYAPYKRQSVTPKQLRLGIRHGHLVEYGVPSKNIPARSFLRKAIDSTASVGVRSFAKELKIGIEREVKKRARQQAKVRR